jgi:hypothetical protein
MQLLVQWKAWRARDRREAWPGIDFSAERCIDAPRRQYFYV